MIPAVNKYEARQGIGKAEPNQSLALVPNSKIDSIQSEEYVFWLFVFLSSMK